MKKYLFARPALFMTTVLLGILTQAIATGTSFYTMYLVDSVMSGDIANLITSAYMGVGIVFVFFLSLWTYTRVSVLLSYKIIVKLKNDIFSSILKTNISDFNQANSGKYISIINNDIKMVNDKYINGILEMSKFITAMIFALGAVAFISPVNALIALILSSSPMVLPALFGKKLTTTNLIHMQKMGDLNEKVKDFLLGFEVIKTFGIEKNIASKFYNAALEAEQSRYNAGKVTVNIGSISGTSIIATQFITFLVAGYFVMEGHITIGAVIAIVNLTSSISHPIQLISLRLADIKSTKDIRNRLLQISEHQDTIARDKKIDFTSGTGIGIQLKNLTFKYETATENNSINVTAKNKKPTVKMIPLDGRSVEEALTSVGITDTKNVKMIAADGEDTSPTDLADLDIAAILKKNGLSDMDLSQVQLVKADNMETISHLLDGKGSNLVIPDGAVLKNISFWFKPNGKYAIVGSSGSGKSTLLNILMGYYDNYIGNITINGSEIRDISRDSLYRTFSMMHQNVFILDDTLRNNITLYNPYSDDEFSLSIEKASLHNLLHLLPEGSEATVGEGGKMLSGGERQRVAIARAIIKGNKVILLDEATANLDNETAYNIEKALLDTPDLTCILVSHRYSKELMRKYDGILVMRDGELVESGTFDELYDKKEYFYSLYNVGGR